MIKKVFNVRYNHLLRDWREFAQDNDIEEIDLSVAMDELFCECLSKDKFDCNELYGDTFSSGFGDAYCQAIEVRTRLTKEEIEKELQVFLDKYDFCWLEIEEIIEEQ